MKRALGVLALAGACFLTACAAPDGGRPAGSGVRTPPDRLTGAPADSSENDEQRSSSGDTGGGGEVAGEGATAVPGYDKRRALRHLRRLAVRIGVRVRATKGERRGISYVARKLRGLGYLVDIQRFRVNGDRSHNLVAHRPDARPSRFVVGGHIDTVAGSRGANDNASGIAVMLEAARVFAGTPQARWLEFVAFGSEEYGTNGGRHHVGSSVYVNRLSNREQNRAPGMVSVDMVADGWPLISGTAGIGPPRVARTIDRIVSRAGIAVDYQTTCDCSDNGPFERAGIPAAFIWSGWEPDHHEPSDRIGNLRVEHLHRSGRALRIFLKEIDFRMIRFFRNS